VTGDGVSELLWMHAAPKALDVHQRRINPPYGDDFMVDEFSPSMQVFTFTQSGSLEELPELSVQHEYVPEE